MGFLNNDPVVHKNLEIQNLENYLRFLNLDYEDLHEINKLESICTPLFHKIAKNQYDHIEKFQPLQQLVEQHSRREVLEKTFSLYFRELLSGYINWNEYLNKRKKIAQAHARIGLTTDWFIGSYARFFEMVFPELCKNIRRPEKLSKYLVSLVKLV